MDSGALLKALWADLPRASYATGGEIDAATYPMPTSIHVEGAGDLAIPISHEDFLKLKAVSTQAPFGRSEQTLLDTDVRRAWQVEASKVSCPQIPDFFCKVARDVAVPAVKELGVDADALGLEVRLYKLLLYEQGGHFKIHRDTEKEVGMFATMILQLPTQEGHEGGELKVHHGQKSLSFDFSGAKSVMGYFNTVFFCDCEHELAEVRSGSRLCLAFNLVRNTAKFLDVDALRLPHYISALGKVQRMLKQWSNWITPRSSSPVLAIPLGHKYTLNSLSFAGLKGYDRVVTALVLSCASFLDVHLCMLQKKLLVDIATDEVEREEYFIESWTSLDDPKSRHLKYSKFDIKNVVTEDRSKDPFERYQTPDERPEEDDLGNEGGGRLTTYYAAVVVIWPKSCRMEALCMSGQSPEVVGNWLDEQHIQEPDRTEQDFQRYLAAYLDKQDQARRAEELELDGEYVYLRGSYQRPDEYEALLEFSVRHKLRNATFGMMKRWFLILAEHSHQTTAKLVVSAMHTFGWEDCYREVIREILDDQRIPNLSGNLEAFPNYLQKNGLQDAALCFAKQLMSSDSVSPELLTFFVGCGLEEESWRILDSLSFSFYGLADSLVCVAEKWGEKSFPRIEKRLKEEEAKCLLPLSHSDKTYSSFLSDVASFVVAVNKQGYHDAALAFAKKFLNGAAETVYYNRNSSIGCFDGMDAIAMLLSCGEKCHATLVETTEPTSVTSVARSMVHAANVIGLKEDKKVTQLSSELLSKALESMDRVEKGGYGYTDINVLDFVLWLGDERLISELVRIVEKNPSVVKELAQTTGEHFYVSWKPELAKEWGDVGKEGFRKVVKALMEYIESDTQLCDKREDGSGKRQKVRSKVDRIKQDSRLEVCAAKIEKLRKLLDDI